MLVRIRERTSSKFRPGSTELPFLRYAVPRHSISCDAMWVFSGGRPRDNKLPRSIMKPILLPRSKLQGIAPLADSGVVEESSCLALLGLVRLFADLEM